MKPTPWEDDRAPLKSKKFVAYMTAEMTWKAVLIVALLVFRDEIETASTWGWWFMISTVLIIGFVEVAYIGGQAALDRYVRVAQITAGRDPGSPPQIPPPDTTKS